MKHFPRNIKFLSILSAAVAALALPQLASAVTTWAQTYGVDTTDGSPDGQDFPFAVAAMPDGGAVVIGKLSIPNTSGDGHPKSRDAIVRYGASGAILWQKALTGTIAELDSQGTVGYGHANVLADALGNIFVISQLTSMAGGGNSAHPYVARLDQNGNLVWQTNLKIPSAPDPYSGATSYLNLPFGSAYFSATGKIVAGGSYQGGPGSQPFITVFNATSGAVEVVKGYGYAAGGVQYQAVWAVCSSRTGDQYVFVTEAGAGDPTSSVVRVDATGLIMNERKLTTNDGIPIAIRPTSDDGYVLLSTNGVEEGLWIRKLGSDLAVLTEKYIPYLTGRSLAPTTDGGFIVAATGNLGNARDRNLLKNEGSGLKAFLVKFSSALSLERISVYGGQSDEGYVNFGPRVASARVTSDGGYVLATSSGSYSPFSDGNRPDWLTVKVDAYGRMQNFRDRMGDVTAQFSITSPPAYVEPRNALHQPLPLVREGVASDLALLPVTATVRSQAAAFTAPPLPQTQAFSVSSVGYQNHNPWQFNVFQPTTAPGRSVRIQYANAAVIESRWADIPGGGQMTLVDPAAGLWQLQTTQPIPDSTSLQYIYFRAIASAPGFADTVSEFSRYYGINATSPSQPPTVTMTAPANTTIFNYEQGFTVSANVTSAVHVNSIALRFNGAVKARGTAASFAVAAKSFPPGDYDLTISATTDLGDTTISAPVRITIRPPAGTVYNFTGPAGGEWTTASNWTPAGVPGAADAAKVVNGAIVSVEGKDITVGSLTVDDAGITGHGKLTVVKEGKWTGGAWANVHLVIGPNVIFAVSGKGEKRLVSVTVDNYGTTSIADAGPAGDDQSIFNNYGSFIFTLQAYFSGSASFGQFENHCGHVGLAGGKLKTTVGYKQTCGDTDLGDGLFFEVLSAIFGSFELDGGTLSGSGFINGNLTQSGGFLSPGHSPGRITVTGNYTQGTGGTLVLEVAGSDAAAGQFDQLQVLGSATLNGALIVRTIDGFVPAATDTFNLITYASEAGNFTSLTSNAKVSLGSNGAAVSLDPGAPNPKTGQPLNISTRMSVLAGDNVLIAGFIVTGPSGSTKKVLVRGIGPSLGTFGVAGTLSDPLLILNKADGTVVTNDNWQQGDTSQIPNGFAPSDPRESVIVATLTPGNYTATLKGAHNETGIGLAEVYDLDLPSAAQLANISTRGFIKTGDDVMIGGFIVGGSEPAKVLVRAIGPSLTNFGVQGALQATTLELHDANGTVISNDGWRATQEADIIATTIPPSNDKEAAILTTLVPGNYTAIVRGKDNTTGIGLVEAYNLH